MAFVPSTFKPNDKDLALGYGHGRVVECIAWRAHAIFGINTSLASLKMARDFLSLSNSVKLFAMTAIKLGFRDQQSDGIICIQNGISAFKVDHRQFIHEALKFMHPGGIIPLPAILRKFGSSNSHGFGNEPMLDLSVRSMEKKPAIEIII
ncbi:MAG: methyltransferase domain-containing protein [candidate division KSB1 bacterium]|nr:methyltransferase domain-containing protein [candidate division KSB1 bacterium]